MHFYDIYFLLILIFILLFKNIFTNFPNILLFKIYMVFIYLFFFTNF